jgi:hypothetical protein
LGSRGLLLVWEEGDCWGAVDCSSFDGRVTAVIQAQLKSLHLQRPEDCGILLPFCAPSARLLLAWCMSHSQNIVYVMKIF